MVKTKYLFLIYFFISSCALLSTQPNVPVSSSAASEEKSEAGQPQPMDALMSSINTAGGATQSNSSINEEIAESNDSNLPNMNGLEKKEMTDKTSDVLTKYSEINNRPSPSDRNYRRMTRQKMEEESNLQASAGSLWKMDGQTSYLFSQNKLQSAGDPTTIKMEGQAMKQIETKVSIIQDLLKDLENQKNEAEAEAKKSEIERQRLAELEKSKSKIITDPKDPNYDPFAGQYPADLQAAEDALAASRKPSSAAEKNVVTDKKNEKEEKIDLKEIEIIPSRVVERMENGLLRVSGQQLLTIKAKPYKVIATGLVRPEDFNEAMISSAKLLDSQYEVIHMKRVQ